MSNALSFSLAKALRNAESSVLLIPTNTCVLEGGLSISCG